jgi:hypothetical protein
MTPIKLGMLALAALCFAGAAFIADNTAKLGLVGIATHVIGLVLPEVGKTPPKQVGTL